MTISPTITIGITSFNAEATITAAMESAQNQSLPAIQIIVVDDASTDRTLELVRSYSNADSRILVLRNPANSGVAVSRNRIVEQAIGDFIAFFDDDDTSHLLRLEKQIQRILTYEQIYANGAPVLCHTSREQIFPDGRVQIEPALGHQIDGPAPNGLFVARHALMGEPLAGGYGACATCSQMARTSTYRQLGGFNPALRRCEDFDLAIRLACAGGHFPGIPEPLVRQQMTPSSEKSLIALEQFTLMAFAEHKDLFDSQDQYNFCLEWIRFKFSTLSGNRRKALLHWFRATYANPWQVFIRLMRALPNWHRNQVFARFVQQIPT